MTGFADRSGATVWFAVVVAYAWTVWRLRRGWKPNRARRGRAGRSAPQLVWSARARDQGRRSNRPPTDPTAPDSRPGGSRLASFEHDRRVAS